MWKKYQDKIYFILFVLQITLIYKLIQIYFTNGHDIKIPLDDKIPFIAPFVAFYMLYAAVLILFFILAYKNKHLFLASSKSFLFAATICSLIYIFFPTAVIRPEILPTTIFNKLVLFIYSIDTAVNAFPSEHITFSILANLCLSRINKKLSYFLWPLTFLIVLSTLFIKQHYIFDVLAGILLAWISYQFIFKRNLSRQTKT
jgi:membrane-associated phospholipid phosphatase